MREIRITEKEYDKLIKRVEFFDTMRNSLLTFSFTSVLTVLGVTLAIDMNSVSAWICLIPFLLIIPFSARISYYRLASAHINSFLKNFDRLDMQFEVGANVVKEGICKHFKLIAWLVNHEMVLLSIIYNKLKEILDEPFEQVENILMGLAALYGHVISWTSRGEWVWEEKRRACRVEKILETVMWVRPLNLLLKRGTG